MFIVIEGLDGSGKTTTANLLAQKSGAVFMPWLQEPFKSMVRRAWETSPPLSNNSEHMIFCGALCHLSDLVREHTEKKQSVVVDRYYYSSLAVHAALAREKKESPLSLNFNALNLMQPDYAFYLDLEENERRIRTRSRSDNQSPTERLLEERPSFYWDVTESFGALIDQGCLTRINVTGKSQEDVTNSILARIQGP